MNSEENKETLMQQEPSVPEEDQNPQLSQENVEGTQPPQPTDLADEQSAQPPLIKGEKKKTVFREIVSWVMTIVIAVALALFIRTFIFEPVRVDGSSMNYTLLDNEYMIVTKYDYWLGEPERFDVVICHYPGRAAPTSSSASWACRATRSRCSTARSTSTASPSTSPTSPTTPTIIWKPSPSAKTNTSSWATTALPPTTAISLAPSPATRSKGMCGSSSSPSLSSV